MTKSLILTLDNTLVVPLSKGKYSLHAEDWKFINQTVEAIADYARKGYKILIISNQPYVASNITPESAFIRKMNLIVTTIERLKNIEPNSICYDYCIDEDSYSYLPKPGMLYEFAMDHEIDLINSVFIGSSMFDKDKATKAGIKTYIDISELDYEI